MADEYPQFKRSRTHVVESRESDADMPSVMEVLTEQEEQSMVEDDAEEELLGEACTRCSHRICVRAQAHDGIKRALLQLNPPKHASIVDSATYCVCEVQSLVTGFLSFLIDTGEFKEEMISSIGFADEMIDEVDSGAGSTVVFSRMKPYPRIAPDSSADVNFAKFVGENFDSAKSKAFPLLTHPVAYVNGSCDAIVFVPPLDGGRGFSMKGTPQSGSPMSRQRMKLEIVNEEELLVSLFNIEGVAPPSIDIEAYIKRLWKYCRISDSSCVLAIVYILRLWRFGKVVVTNRNVHKLCLAAFVASAKFNEDATLTNKNFASVGGIKVSELNSLEIAFFRLLRFKLDVTMDEWLCAVQTLVSPYSDLLPSRADISQIQAHLMSYLSQQRMDMDMDGDHDEAPLLSVTLGNEHENENEFENVNAHESMFIESEADKEIAQINGVGVVGMMDARLEASHLQQREHAQTMRSVSVNAGSGSGSGPGSHSDMVGVTVTATAPFMGF